MKKILIILTIAFGFIACQENDFVDFGFTGGYFPDQYPVKVFDLFNSATDGIYSFQIPVVMGGVYKNTQERIFNIEIAPDLCDNVLFQSTNDMIYLMPSTHYTLSSNDKIIIPAGKLNGSIEVKLTDAFFNDPLASKLHYVIPIRIKSVTNLDSVLRGKSTLNQPDPRVASQWIIVPKDYVMIPVKYINKYQGNYFLRGVSTVKDPSENLVETNVYKNIQIWNVLPMGKDQVFTNSARNSELLEGNQQLNISINATGNIIISNSSGSGIGVGQFVKDGDELGGVKRNLMALSYKYPVQYTAPTPEDPVKIIDDIDSQINYAGSWFANSDVSFYGGTRHYSRSGSFTFTFTGDGIALYWRTGPSDGAFDVYLNDMNTPVQANVSAVTPTIQYKQKLYEVTGLPLKSHTIKVTVKNRNTYFDYLTYNVTQIVVPSGQYTFEAKDTLVLKDRIFPVETFTPLVY